ncbi:PREDICTED: uncharacterized protein LOC105561860 [Vollenhovia emeryi]|uniref:uncharacterized protein LOC105561860 n=1 Tax=Vollenhovia emeryi TaxID=411798 RepID=UPI0005F562FC|nr:PREDICTED: uncharacterized protein LOC105561860 [Vollenhovia emeryi]XP_011867603.1 PREDICTED: uncharacterized protein LOC105561860 [Vollenhovia emeryi]
MKRLFRQWFKTKTKQDVARLRQRMAIVYAVVGWHAFGFIFYSILKKEVPEDAAERRMAYGHLTGTSPNMKVYQVTGLTLTKDFEIAYKAKVDQIERENKESEDATAETDEP